MKKGNNKRNYICYLSSLLSDCVQCYNCINIDLPISIRDYSNLSNIDLSFLLLGLPRIKLYMVSYQFIFKFSTNYWYLLYCASMGEVILYSGKCDVTTSYSLKMQKIYRYCIYILPTSPAVKNWMPMQTKFSYHIRKKTLSNSLEN